MSHIQLAGITVSRKLYNSIYGNELLVKRESKRETEKFTSTQKEKLSLTEIVF